MATQLEERPIWIAARPRADRESPVRPDVERVVPWLVFLVAVGLAIALYASFWPHARDLWFSLEHDRSAHYELGMNLAMDLRHFNVPGLLHHLDGARVWGPLHGIVLSWVQVIAPDMRFCIVPSWCAWIATIVLGFLVTRRLIPTGGTAAGILAASLIALSPAHRAYATDVMLESMGAALTLLCLHRYLIAIQDADNVSRGRWLGFSLTILFLTKANYWLLVVLGLSVGECFRQPRAIFGWAIGFLRYCTQRSVLVSQLRNPLNWLIVGLFASAAGIAITGGGTLQLGSFKVSLTRGHNIVHLAYALLFLRVALWWRRERIGVQLRDHAPLAADLACWFVWPVAAYFLLPKRLGYFLWYATHSGVEDRSQSGGLLGGLSFHFNGLIDDYHASFGLAVAVLVCVALCLATIRWWRPGAAAVFCFLVVAALVTCQHPMHKYRLAHTWVALLWVLGSAGLMSLVFFGRSLRPMRIGLATAICLAVAIGHGSLWIQPGHAQEGGRRTDRPNALTIPEAYLPAVKDARHVTILSRIYTPFFLAWTFQETHHHQRFATTIEGVEGESPDVEKLKAWAQKGRSDMLVLIDAAKSSPWFFEDPGNLNVAACRELLERDDSGFRLTQEWTLPEEVRITLWTRK